MCEAIDIEARHFSGLRCRMTFRAEGRLLAVDYRLYDPDGLPIRAPDMLHHAQGWEQYCDAVVHGFKPSFPPGWRIDR